MADDIARPQSIRETDEKQIAILTQGAGHPGGVTTLVNGLSEWLQHNSDYQPTIISLAESRSDPRQAHIISEVLANQDAIERDAGISR